MRTVYLSKKYFWVTFSEIIVFGRKSSVNNFDLMLHYFVSNQFFLWSKPKTCHLESIDACEEVIAHGVLPSTSLKRLKRFHVRCIRLLLLGTSVDRNSALWPRAYRNVNFVQQPTWWKYNVIIFTPLTCNSISNNFVAFNQIKAFPLL